MNILVDIGHPGHVHLFKNVAAELKKHGHNLFFSVREIPVAKRLMDIYGMPYLDLGEKSDSVLGKAWTVLKQDFRMLKFAKKNHIDIGLSSGIVISHVSKLTKMKSFMFDDDDDEAEPFVVKYGHPLTDVVMTPAAIKRKTANAVYYKGTHELAYLHPNWFRSDESVLERAGLKVGEPFFIMRFVALKGHHDIGQAGLSFEQKQRLIDLLRPFGRVIITSERAVEPEFEPYRMPVAPEDMHSLMSYASLFVGDSQTMTSEAALLGVPAFKCNTFAGKLSVPNMYENYGLCKSFTPTQFDEMCAEIQTLLTNPGKKMQLRENLDHFLADTIDVTAYLTWFIENYPKSRDIMIQNPDYQWKFK